MSVVATVTGAWSAFWTKVGVFLPDFLGAVLILFFGWVGSNLAKTVSVRLLRLCRVNHFAERAGITQVLQKGEVKESPAEILGLFVFWFFFLIAIVAALDTLGLPGVTDTLTAIFLYVPKILAAIIILILGLYVANFLEAVTRTSCANAGLKHAESIGRITYYGTAVFIIAAILETLGIATEIVVWGFILIFGSVCLAAGLAFGLGGRELAARQLARWLEEKREP
jgi:hypothetical protein